MSTRVSRLDNGMTVVTDAMPQLETSSVGVWVDTGSRAETAMQQGVSHMLEHMALLISTT